MAAQHLVIGWWEVWWEVWRWSRSFARSLPFNESGALAESCSWRTSCLREPADDRDGQKRDKWMTNTRMDDGENGTEWLIGRERDV